MSFELVNTSVARGLRVGASGFCTVAMTRGLPPALEERLTLLSSYRFPTASENSAGGNPVCFSHARLPAGDATVSVLSRIAAAGFDYSRRSNRVAHHVILGSSELPEPGPAWVIMRPGLMRESWTQMPTMLDASPIIPAGVRVSAPCRAWHAAAGDAGWAGVLAETFIDDPARVAWLIYPPGVAVLHLIDEAVGLLSAASRWEVTFSTYFTDLPAGVNCNWRCCPAESRTAHDARKVARGALVIDLTQPMPDAPPGRYVDAARAGTPSPIS